ncbi:MAG: porin family protein [Flavobacteriales bacterium]
MRTITPHSVALGIALVLGISVQAQGPAFGIKGGLNVSNLHVNDANKENSRLGFNLGVFGRTDPEGPVGLQVELLYSTKGTHTTYNAFFGLVDQDVDFNLNYLELPVLVGFRLGPVLELQAGGYAGYLLSAKVKTSGDLGSGSDELDRDHFRSADFGVVGGVALNFGNAQIGARYNYGLTEIADSNGAKAVLGDAKNACAQLYVAIGLGR